jgi:hypothetical protein
MSSLNTYLDQLKADQDTKDQLAASLGQAANTNPDQYAEQIRLGKVTNMSPEIIPDVRDAARQIDFVQSAGIDKLYGGSPKTAHWLADPENAKIASDSIPHLSGIETMVKDFSGLFGSIGAGWSSGNAGFVGAARSVYDLVRSGKSGIGMGGLIARSVEKTQAEKDQLKNDAGTKFFSGWQDYFASEADRMRPKYISPAMAAVGSGIESFTQNAQNLMFMFGGGEAAAPAYMTAMMSQVYGNEYKAGVDSGMSPEQASLHAGEQAYWEYVTEKIPLTALVKDLKADAPFWKMLGHQMFTENITEQAATAIQDFTTWANIDANKGKTFAEYAAERPDAAYQTLIATTVGTAAMSGSSFALNRAMNGVGQFRRAKHDQRFIKSLTDVSAAAPLKARDTDTFEQFVKHQVDGSPVENLYIDGNKFNDVLLQGGVTSDQLAKYMPDLAEKVAQASQTGEDVVIPTEVYAARIAGTDLGEALKPHLRVDSEAVSLHEAVLKLKEIQDLVAGVDEADQPQQKPEIALDFVSDPEVLSRTVSQGIETDSGETGTRDVSFRKAQDEIRRKTEMLKSLLDCMHNG